MSIPVIAFSAGLFLIVMSVLGGGIEVKEIRIPNLGLMPRIVTFFLGSGLIGICILWPELLTKTERLEEPVSAPQVDHSHLNTLLTTNEHFYKLVNSTEVGATFDYPNNIFSVDSTESVHHELILRDGEGNVRVKITRTALPDEKDIKAGRAKEKDELERLGYKITYFWPQKDSDWRNYYVLTGVGFNMVFYYRRWYLGDSVGSLEFTFPKEQSPVYESIITTMAHDIVFMEGVPKPFP